MDDTTRRRPNILLITTDQQRFDSLGCNGNPWIDTPAIDSLAATGLRYSRAHVQNVLCMPSRATILTGQHPATHGVWSNGVCLPREAPSVAAVLRDAGYATAHIGKIHFESFYPTWAAHLAAQGQRPLMEYRFAGGDLERNADGSYRLEPGAVPKFWLEPTEECDAGHRGFDHVETCNHTIVGHYAQWLAAQIGQDEADRLAGESTALMVLGAAGNTDTGVFQGSYSAIPAELHSSTWTAERTIAWFDAVPAGQPFFCWTSFDDPHHPFNPPAAYGRRHDWRDVPLPHARGADREAIERDLAGKPAHYLAYYRGSIANNEGEVSNDPRAWPCNVSDDQIREMTALTAGMVELIDESVGRLLDALRARGLDRDTHVFFTSDHGDMGGDHGLLLKGPFHLDGLMRVPFLWHRPGSIGAGTVHDPVGLVDLAPTFCRVARVPVPDWMDGTPLPVEDGERTSVLTTFDSPFDADVSLRTLYADGRVLTVMPRQPGVGELYDLDTDPDQFENRWSDRSRRAERDDLVALLHEQMPEDARAERLPWWDLA
jgi:arylsulfatase A-like enzyme